MHVPVLSIIFMAVSAVVSIGVPIVLFLFFHRKFNAKVLPMLIGIAAFTIFALVLESLIHRIVLTKFALRETPALYILYGIFMAGIFEETARFLGFNILKKKYDGIGTGLAYGIGHGGFESVMLAGVTMLVAFAAGIMINMGYIELITGKLQGEMLEAVNTQIDSLVSTAPYMFLVSCLERMFAIAIQISLSIMVFYAVYRRKMLLYPLAILFHAVIDIPAAAMQVSVLKNVFFVEGLAGVCAVLMVLFAVFLYKKMETV